MQKIIQDPLLWFFNEKLDIDDAMGIGGAQVKKVKNFLYHIASNTLLIDWVDEIRYHSDWIDDKEFREYYEREIERVPALGKLQYDDLIEKTLYGRFGIISFDEADLEHNYGVPTEEFSELINGQPFVCVWTQKETKNALDSLSGELLKRGLPGKSICYAAYKTESFHFDPFYLEESYKTIKVKEREPYEVRWRRTIGDDKNDRDKSKLIARIKKISKILTDIFSIENYLSENKFRSDELFYDLSFLRWLRSHGIEIRTGQVPFYREGGTARAYFIADKVVKLTTNRVEANVAYLAKKKDNPNTVTLAVKKFGDYYAILMPRVDMEGLENDYKRAADLLTVYIDSDDFDELPKDEAEQRRICQDIADEYGDDPSIVSFMVDIMSILRKLYDDTGFVHTDATPTNIGKYQGRLVIPDLGPNQPSYFDPEAELSKIKAKRTQLNLPDEPLI